MIHIRIIGVMTGLACCLPFCTEGAAQLEVDGLGWRANIRNKNLLEDILDIKDNPDAVLDPVIVEDALFILGGELSRNGYLSPEINYSLFQDENLIHSGSWNTNTQLYDFPLENGNRLLLQVRKGVRAHVMEVEFTGLVSIPFKEARSYFIPEGGLIVPKTARSYSPMKLESQLRSLRQRLRQLGYLEADVSVTKLPQVQENGEVTIQVKVSEGVQFIWGEASCMENPAEGVNAHASPPHAGESFSLESLQDWIAEVRKQYFVAGYPHVNIASHQDRVPNTTAGKVSVHVKLDIEPGSRVRLGNIGFDGIVRTNEAFLVKQTRLKSGNWLSRPEIQAAQLRLDQLGIFGRVLAEYEERSAGAGAPVSDVRFVVSEREPKSLSVLFGYGSYEQFRIGMEARALNILGRAHSGHIRLRQSMRSSAGALFYSIPRPLPWLVSAQLRLQGLMREEVSFDREEALIAVGVERDFLGRSIRTTAEYRYELLRSKGFEPLTSVGDTKSTAGSLNFGFSWDTRDQLVSPRNGASLQGLLEVASTALGSETNYQRLLVRSSYHHSFDNDWLRFHLGLEGGLLLSMGSSPLDFPTNKRFFPGGENSIRGYKEGEASPLDAEGVEIGAEAFALNHIEFEVVLSDSLSMVTFLDGLWSTPHLEDDSHGEFLFSAGMGLRYITPLGPLRLEYAHNINPRPTDPNGTLHLSVGFPF